MAVGLSQERGYSYPLSEGCGSSWAQAEAKPEWLLGSPPLGFCCCRVGLTDCAGQLSTAVPPAWRRCPGLSASTNS